MSENISIELDNEFLKNLYELNNSSVPELSQINLDTLKQQVSNIKQYIQSIQNNKTSINTEVASTTSQEDAEAPTNYNLPTLQFIDPSSITREKKQYYDDNGHHVKGKVLIIDDLGTITYQLSVIFKRAGYLPITSREIYDAVDKFKRSTYDYVVMDLFIPTEREGFILLEELKKISTSRKETSVFAIMSASTRKEHKQNCERRGAAFYVEKIGDWQKELFNMLLQY